MKTKCPLCDFENEESAKFCSNCNIPLIKPEVSDIKENPYIEKENKKLCPKCGAERKSEIECPFCGVIYSKYEKILERQKAQQQAASPQDCQTPKTDEVKLPLHDQQRMKKLISPIIVVSVILALAISFIGYKFYLNIEKRNAEREFSALVVSISGKLIKLAIDSEDVVDEINKAWREAIFSKPRDFNEAIMEIRLKRAADISAISKLSTNISDEIKKMTPPNGKEKDFQRLKELYLLFNKYADMAASPSGSLQSYSQQNSQLATEIKSAIKELEMMK